MGTAPLLRKKPPKSKAGRIIGAARAVAISGFDDRHDTKYPKDEFYSLINKGKNVSNR